MEQPGQITSAAFEGCPPLSTKSVVDLLLEIQQDAVVSVGLLDATPIALQTLALLRNVWRPSV